jgi:hypothetical protein
VAPRLDQAGGRQLAGHRTLPLNGPTAAVPCNISSVPFDGKQLQACKKPGRGHSVSNQFREARRSPQSANALRDIFCNELPELVVACASPSTGRGGSSRRLLGRRWRHGRGRGRSRGRGGSRSDAWFTATIHHAHFSSAALANRGTHRGVPYADAIDQLTPQATSLANLNDRIARLLKGDVRHTLC